jgi:transducin (beta)-like 1
MTSHEVAKALHIIQILALIDIPYHRACNRSIHVCSVASASSSAIRTFTGHTDEVNGVCWSPGGVYLASCSDDSTAKIWSLEAPSDGPGLVHDLRGHSKEIYTVRWTPTGPCSNNPDKPLLLCTASFDGTVKVCFYSSVWHSSRHFYE